jgi:acetylglutamate/LysW-gamma-L-alpha-aminoadipate kinase
MILVVKLGGSILEEYMPEPFLDDLRKAMKDRHIALVHGGRKIVNETSSMMGKEQKFVVSPEGFRSRYTDEETIEIFTMAMAGKINKSLVATLLKSNIAAVGLCGIDGKLVRAKRKKELIVVDDRGRRKIIEGGFTGKIERVDSRLLRTLLDQGYTPVIAPIAIGEEFEKLNVDGDRMAAYIAGELKAELLILLTDVDGVIIDERLRDTLTLNEVKNLPPKMGHGMITKIYAATEALEMGVKEVIITSGLKNNPITAALEHTAGTMITNE